MKNMITILVLLCVTVGCSSNQNLKTANKTTSINGDNLVVLSDEICNNFISDENKIYGCGVGYSADITISKSKALLNAKVLVADVLFSNLNKKQSHTITEDTPGEIIKVYNSEEMNVVFEQSIPYYKIVYSKTFKEKGKYYRSFIVVEYSREV